MTTHTYLHLLDRAARIELQARKLKALADLYREAGICCTNMIAESRAMLNHAADIRGRAAGRV